MPVIKGAKKKLRADQRKRAVNIRVKRMVRDALKKFDDQATPASLSEAYSVLDTAAKKNIIPKKRADRKKARLAATLTRSIKSSPKKVVTHTNKPTSKKSTKRSGKNV